MDSQRRANYQNEFDRLQGAKRLTALHPNVRILNERYTTQSKTIT